MAGHQCVPCDHVHAAGIQPRAHHVPGPLAGDRVAVARHRHQAGAADPRRALHVAVKRRRHAHEVLALDLQHLGDAQLPVLRVRRVRPHRLAALGQPRVEFGKAGELALSRLQPHPPPAVLHILLHHPLLPARGHVAEVRIEQVVAAHGRKPGIDHPALALLDLVHRRLHVVVDAPASHAAERRKRPRVRVKQHLVPLAGVRHQPERARGAQLQVRHLRLVVHPAHHDAFVAPVKLERLAQLEAQRHKRLRGVLARVLSPRPDEVRHRAVAATVALGLDLHKQRPRRAPLVPNSVGIRLERRHQRRLKRRELAHLLRPLIPRLDRRRRLQPLLDGVPRQTRLPRDLADRNPIAHLHAPDLANHVHGDHLVCSCQKIQQSRDTPWSILKRHSRLQMVSFRSASTACALPAHSPAGGSG